MRTPPNNQELAGGPYLEKNLSGCVWNEEKKPGVRGIPGPQVRGTGGTQAKLGWGTPAISLRWGGGFRRQKPEHGDDRDERE